MDGPTSCRSAAIFLCTSWLNFCLPIGMQVAATSMLCHVVHRLCSPLSWLPWLLMCTVFHNRTAQRSLCQQSCSHSPICFRLIWIHHRPTVRCWNQDHHRSTCWPTAVHKGGCYHDHYQQHVAMRSLRFVSISKAARSVHKTLHVASAYICCLGLSAPH